MEARWRCRIIGMADEVSDKYSRGAIMVEEMRDNRYGYGDGGDVGQQQIRCGTTEMAKWVGRMSTDWENIDRERLST